MSMKKRRNRAETPRSDSSIHSINPHSTEVLSHRQARLEHILLREIQSLLRDEAKDEVLQSVQPISMTLSPDGGHARVGYAVLASLSQERQSKSMAQEALARAAGFLRARLASSLNLKRLPKLSFTFIGVVEPRLERGDEWFE
jgi:ribosome-binding factor A